MSRTNREQSSRAMATTVMKFKGQFKNIWAPPQKNRKFSQGLDGVDLTILYTRAKHPYQGTVIKLRFYEGIE